jgi:hypothetical protein
VAAVLPEVPCFHLWGIKYRTYREIPFAFPVEISSDSSQWTGQRVRGKTPGRKAWQESGKTQLAYAYTEGLPAYEAQLCQAFGRLARLPPAALPTLDADPEIAALLRRFLLVRALMNQTILTYGLVSMKNKVADWKNKVAD